MSAHTPGPWTADLDSDHGDFVVWGPKSDDAFVANIGTAPESDRVVAFDVSRANARLIAAAPDMAAVLTSPAWLIWSNEHGAWWGPESSGYRVAVKTAGRYTLEEAIQICRGAGMNTPGIPSEVMVPSPEWIAAREAALAKAGLR